MRGNQSAFAKKDLAEPTKKVSGRTGKDLAKGHKKTPH